MDIKWIILIAAWGLHFSNGQKNKEVFVEECYKTSTMLENRTPMNLRVLIDLIQKAERHFESSMDMKSIAMSLLKRFKLDGIEYYSESSFTHFGVTGSQRSKNRIIEKFISQFERAEEFPAEVLTLPERCGLHHALSNTIWKHSPVSEDKICNDEVTANTSVESMPDAVIICPIEYGVIATPFGTIAPGTIIAAIAASPESVDPPGKTMVDNSTEELDTIDSIWAVTVAGDLAETAVYQGPILGERMVLGDTGFWNNLLRSYTYYLKGRDGTFDSTQAKIIGAIDGLIIAKNLPGWIKKFPNLRLSQVLDMYYSNRGVHVDGIVRACDRAAIFRHVAPKPMLKKQNVKARALGHLENVNTFCDNLEQAMAELGKNYSPSNIYNLITNAISQFLKDPSGVRFMPNEILETFVKHAVDKFTAYTSNHSFTELQCQEIEEIHPSVETIVAFDGAWSQEETADFLAVLLDDIDVSVFGSKIGILHGTTGEWTLNVTNSPAIAYEAFDHFDRLTWPSQINFTKVLSSASDYYDEMWSAKHKNHVIGNLGQVIVFLVPGVRFTAPIEQESILESLKKLKEKHPDLHFVYYVSVDNAPLFEPFFLSANDHLVKESRIKDALLNVSRVLRPAPCILNVTEGTRDRIEDYVSPQESVIYRLDPVRRNNIKQITLTVHNVDYGTIEVCTWNQRRDNATREGFYCRKLSGHNETKIIDYATCNDRAVSSCRSTTHYEIRGISTRNRCTEIGCRTPEHIRYILSIENLYCSHATIITIIKQFLIAMAIIMSIFLIVLLFIAILYRVALYIF